MKPTDQFAVIDSTQSVCPICLKTVEASIIVRDNAVYMEKNCCEHGSYTVYLWPDAEHYRWMQSFKIPTLRPHSPTPAVKGCPEDCGLCMAHRRHPTLVEIEVTDRCNLRCPVCFMAAGEVRAAMVVRPAWALSVG